MRCHFPEAAAMDDISLPFTMQATVVHGEPPPSDPLDEGPLPSGWVRIPVSFQITLPTELSEGGGRRGTPPSGADAKVALVPHSLRLGTGQPGEDERTWQDFDAPLGALHDDPSTLDAAFHDDWSPAVPVPPWLTQGRLPSFENHDAFLDFLDDPHRHPPAATPAPGVRPPRLDVSAAPHPTGGASSLGQRAAAAAEMGLGGGMMVAGAGETALGAATAPEGVGVPVAVEGIATAGTGLGLYEDGRRRWNEAARTAHPDPGPPVPPLVPPVAAPPPEGFSTDPKAARPHGLVTTPVSPAPKNEGLVVDPPRGPAVVTLYGDDQPDKIHHGDQDNM